MASDTGTIDLERVADERRRIEAGSADTHDGEVEHPAVVAQRIVDEVLRQRHLGVVDLDEEHLRRRAAERVDAADGEPGDARTIARRIVEDVLHDHRALERSAASAAPATAEPAIAEPDTDDGRLPAFESRRTDRVYLTLPGRDGPLVLIPGVGTDPDTEAYVPDLPRTDDLDVRGWDGAALVERALAPLTRAAPATAPAVDVPGEPYRRSGFSEHVAWIALAGLWLVAMAALVPLFAQGLERSVDATPPDVWEDSAVVEDGAPAGEDLDQELDPDAEEPEIGP